jgi:hypothetical protein
MTFVDWSDPAEMLGLLAEYVADARLEAAAEPSRARRLEALLDDLTRVSRLSEEGRPDEALEGLRRVHASHADDLAGDPVLRHLEDCLEELERIRAEHEV